MVDLERNVNQLENVAEEVRKELEIDRDDLYVGHAVRRFYHLALLQCAGRMSPKAFAQCIQTAQEQMRRTVR